MKKILLSSLVIGVVAVVAIGATIAYFTDRDTLGANTVNSANLSINIDESAHSVPITVAGLLPGQSSNPYLVRFENDGGVPVKYAWSAERMVRSNERLNNESLMLFEVLHVEVAEYISGTLTPVYAGPLSELTLKEGTSTLNNGSARNAQFVFSMPAFAGNDYKNLSTGFNLILDATQVTNPGWTAEPIINFSFNTESDVLGWSVDRTKPYSFGIANFDEGSRLKHSINEVDHTSGFHATQGMKHDTQDSSRMSIDLYIPASWENTNSRMAGFWGRGYDASDKLSLYPIIEFASNNGTPRFTVWPVDPYVGGWRDLGLPTGFEYDQWYTLTMQLEGDNVTFSVGDLTHTIDNNNTAYFGEVFLQGYNNSPGLTYDIYWDNFIAW